MSGQLGQFEAGKALQARLTLPRSTLQSNTGLGAIARAQVSRKDSTDRVIFNQIKKTDC